MKLIWRMRLLAFISIAFSLVISYDILFRSLPWIGILGFGTFGFIFGFFLFKRMNKITWDENKEVVSIGRFDATSFIILGVYVLYRIGINIFLKEHYESAVLISGFSISTLWGGMIGRLLGTVYRIRRIHRENTSSYTN